MKRQMIGTSVTMSGTTSANEWQQMTMSGTTSDNNWYNKWQRMTTSDYFG